MERIVFFIVSLFATMIGAMSGIGGGVIIKPVLDVVSGLESATVGFLSGCTVIAMSIISIFKSRGSGASIEPKTTVPIAIGAVVGGTFGKIIFDYLRDIFSSGKVVSVVQSILMATIMAVILLYFIFKNKITSRKITNVCSCVIIGLMLGFLAAFLGVGGGPLNMIVLAYFFSMETKVCATNSIFIVFFSQASSIFFSVITKKVPDFDVITLVVMITAGIMGGFIGSNLLKKFKTSTVRRMFYCVIVFMMFTSIYRAHSLLK